MSPNDFQDKMDEAFELIQNDADSALSIFNELLVLDSENIELLNGKGSALMKMDRMDEAEQCFNEAVLIEENPSALINKGIILKKRGEYQSALKFYDRAVQLDSSFNRIVLVLKKELIDLIDDKILNNNSFSSKANECIRKGINCRDNHRFCDALDCFYQAISEDKTSKYPVMALVEEIKTMLFNEFMFDIPEFEDEKTSSLKIQFFNALFVEEDPKKALVLMDILLEINENDLDTLNFKGCILFLFEKYSESIKCFERCLEINSNYYYALFNKGLILRLMHDFEESLNCFDMLLDVGIYGDKVEFYRLDALKKLGGGVSRSSL